jgi:competence protein ComEC
VRAFASDAWITREGLTRPFDPQAEAELAFDCDRMGCQPKLGVRPAIGAWWGRKAVPAERLAALCSASDIVVVRGPPPATDACPGALMLTRDDFDRGGSAEIYPTDAGWRVVWAAAARGRRPWSEPALTPSAAAPAPVSAPAPAAAEATGADRAEVTP